ncbi:hypothetical protein PFICI_10023 [Pestalotiopsis fici W106-1]|uniref:Uncharacterized protein n=1 Tax=Pestalotiopsis fici (strain W106-1 / CGMCC3.15140) TaxID=1229662 RepID=W3WYJ5_PESFW|nr:uncharacterized protein PFICI_10023 [Pestalotiopsis fici W106-1]ETS77961.1 hypothetical protein PFICI_10023 [Pestalotiopsis fici W106-1]
MAEPSSTNNKSSKKRLASGSAAKSAPTDDDWIMIVQDEILHDEPENAPAYEVLLDTLVDNGYILMDEYKTVNTAKASGDDLREQPVVNYIMGTIQIGLRPNDAKQIVMESHSLILQVLAERSAKERGKRCDGKLKESDASSVD